MAKRWFARLADWLNLDDLLLGAREPQDATTGLLAEMEDDLAQARQAVAAAIVEERRLEQHRREAQAQAAEWDARTDAALRAGDETQARRALKRKLACQRAAEEQAAKLERHRQRLAEVKAGLSALQARIQEARRRHDRPAASG